MLTSSSQEDPVAFNATVAEPLCHLQCSRKMSSRCRRRAAPSTTMKKHANKPKLPEMSARSRQIREPTGNCRSLQPQEMQL
ncbi:hypothetical protein M5K25_011231 [Dendrobium thyrsiflorum]|uniref:Uncharacterized protein n=1 Tax=Dendrobium thyrsiflorum TaxID=117978 RepID=A0ABD0V262_DENTH